MLCKTEKKFKEDSIDITNNPLPAAHISDLMKQIISSASTAHQSGMVSKANMVTINETKQIKLALEGNEIYNLIVNEIRKAKKQILIQTFIWDPTAQVISDIKEALCEVGRNNKDNIDVYLLTDKLGPIADKAFSFSVTAGHKAPTRPKGNQPEDFGLTNLPDNVKVHIGIYSHNGLNSTHAKTVIVDGETLVITGANFQLTNYGPNCNYDAALSVQGPVAKSAFFDFLEIWKLSDNNEELNYPHYNSDMIQHTELNTSEDKAVILFASSKSRNRGYLDTFFNGNNLSQNPITNSYLSAIENAEQTIRITTSNLNETNIVNALANFVNAKDGTLELIIGKEFNAKREKWVGGTNEDKVISLINQVDLEKRKNLKFYWYSRNGKQNNVIHLKLMLVDDMITIFGSSNLDKTSLNHCHEANIIIDHKDTAQRVLKELYLPALTNSIPVSTAINPESDIDIELSQFN